MPTRVVSVKLPWSPSCLEFWLVNHATAPAGTQMKPWYEVDSHAAAVRLGADPQRGLTAAEAARRLTANGPNELIAGGARNGWRIAWEQVTATMVVILIVAAVVSAAVGDYHDAVAILAIVVLN